MSRSAAVLAETFARSAIRQPVFAVLLVVPPVMGLFLRLALSLLDRRLPGFDSNVLLPLLLAVTAGFPPYLYGLLASLMLLDERDRDLVPALRVTPISLDGLLLAKIVPASVLTFAAVPVTLNLSGRIGVLPVWTPIAGGLLAAVLAALYTLVIIRFSATKVQALTAGKILGTALIAPTALVFLPRPWSTAFLLVPGNWIASSFLRPSGLLYAAIGLVYITGLTLLFWKTGRKRYFS